MGENPLGVEMGITVQGVKSVTTKIFGKEGLLNSSGLLAHWLVSCAAYPTSFPLNCSVHVVFKNHLEKLICWACACRGFQLAHPVTSKFGRRQKLLNFISYFSVLHCVRIPGNFPEQSTKYPLSVNAKNWSNRLLSHSHIVIYAVNSYP